MDHTKELIEMAHKGDMKARERLVTENMGLIGSIVKRFVGRGYEQEDLFQIGSIGLIKAVDNFDISYDVKFSTYAVPMITGEIRRFLRDDGIIKVSRTIKENAVKCAKAVEELRKDNCKEPTIEEIAKKSGLETEDIVMSISASSEVESLNKVIYQGDGNEVLLMDKIEDNVSRHEELLNSIVVRELLEDLTEREKNIIIMRYFDEMTQTQVADKLGISQVQVSRMEKKILGTMRSKLV
ncbi:MAG: SigF/SigG family RNA polymerase sporulation sigma factor [Lachnospira sp.]|nr:SigF/SigG family RNA polymerase sporulation sigma factor [Lachnospira sp.]MDD5828769.1 SigF/SigG family RNA polymerase sporulation sigma factor [Lachnospira sp.]